MVDREVVLTTHPDCMKVEVCFAFALARDSCTSAVNPDVVSLLEEWFVDAADARHFEFLSRHLTDVSAAHCRPHVLAIESDLHQNDGNWN